MTSVDTSTNRDEATKALEAAQKKRDAGDDAGARRFLEKALRLDPTLSVEASKLSDWLNKCASHHLRFRGTPCAAAGVAFLLILPQLPVRRVCLACALHRCCCCSCCGAAQV